MPVAIKTVFSLQKTHLGQTVKVALKHRSYTLFKFFRDENGRFPEQIC